MKDIFKTIADLFPLIIGWIRARLEAGETEEEIRRDIIDRTAEIAANRAKRDEEFKEKFGEDL